MLRSIWSFFCRRPAVAALLATALFVILPEVPPACIWPVRVLLLVLVLALFTAFGRWLREVARDPKPVVFRLVAAVLGLGLAYGAAELASWAYTRRNPLSGNPFILTELQKRHVESIVNGAVGYQVYSPSLGWEIGRSQTSKDGLYRSNASGFRANREYSPIAPEGKIRVLCFGDSFTHCDEVGNEETWPHHAELAAPGVEFLNFGVPGYGLTQAYVRYREVAPHYPAQFVIIGCMTEDTKRGVNVYYPFRYANPENSPNAVALPFARLDEAGQLEVCPPFIASREEYAAFLKNPAPVIKKMARYDILYRPHPPTPLLALLADRWEGLEQHLAPAMDHALESWHRAHRSGTEFRSLRDRQAARNGRRSRRIAEVCRPLFLRFAREVEKNGSVPLIVWFPSPMNLKNHNEDRKRDYQHYLDFFREQDLLAVDTLDWLEEIEGEGNPLQVEALLENVHFSASANAHVGRRLGEMIRKLSEADQYAR